MARDLWRQRILAIDPGDRHCGVAIFRGGECQHAAEMSPNEMLRLVDQAVTSSSVEVVVVESFTLYPDKAAEQAGSAMLTAQAIGAIRWIVQKHNELVAGFADPNGERLGELDTVELVMQAAAIKVPTRSVVRHHGIRPVSVKTKGEHQRDAELHGLHFILRGQGLIRGSESNRGTT